MLADNCPIKVSIWTPHISRRLHHSIENNTLLLNLHIQCSLISTNSMRLTLRVQSTCCVVHYIKTSHSYRILQLSLLDESEDKPFSNLSSERRDLCVAANLFGKMNCSCILFIKTTSSTTTMFGVTSKLESSRHEELQIKVVVFIFKK